MHNSTVVTHPLQKAQTFNSFLNSVFTTSDFILRMDQLPSPMDQLYHITIDDLDVYEALVTLDPTRAPGIDNISPYILKPCACSLLTPKSHLLNICL